MKAIEPSEPKTEEAKKKVAFGAAGVSLFLHLGLFVLVGGVVVVEYAVPRSPMTGELTPVVNADELNPPVEETPEAMGEPESPEVASEMPAASAESAPIDLNVSSIDVLTVSTPVSSFQMPASVAGTGGNGLAAAVGTPSGGGGGSGKRGKISNPFGGSERLGNASLEGVLYDLKQTRDGKPSGMNANKYVEVLVDFFKRDWSRTMLNDYYRVKNPLYTSQIYMPLMSAGVAPTAFQVEKEVKPAQWIVLYEGSFQAPKSGQYRFAGYADDMLAVRVNGKTVLDGSRMSMGADKQLVGTTLVKVSGQEFVQTHKLGNGVTAYSEWLRFEEGQTNKIEILVGERPGGQFCAYLFIEEKNKNYKKEASGRPILPLFRTADMETTMSKEAAFEADGPVFGSK